MNHILLTSEFIHLTILMQNHSQFLLLHSAPASTPGELGAFAPHFGRGALWARGLPWRDVPFGDDVHIHRNPSPCLPDVTWVKWWAWLSIIHMHLCTHYTVMIGVYMINMETWFKPVTMLDGSCWGGAAGNLINLTLLYIYISNRAMVHPGWNSNYEKEIKVVLSLNIRHTDYASVHMYM